MLRLLLFVFTLLCFRIVEAQSLSPTVLNAAGGTVKNNAHSLDWSLGELAVNIIDNSNNMLTQGFLQQYLSTVKITDLFDEQHFSYFPNPVSYGLHFQTDIGNIQKVQVYNMLGNLLFENEFQPMLDMHLLFPGTYVVCMLNHQHQLLYTFKINKI